MNIAYLILAHHQPALIERMVERLNQRNVDFYVHVDKKSKDLAAIQRALSRFQNVEVISAYSVHGTRFSIVQSTLNLMALAYHSGKQYKYYVLMSGQDYPIKPNTYINHFFETHTEDFISYNQLAHLPANFTDKVRHYHFPDRPYDPKGNRDIPMIVKLYFGVYNRLKGIMSTSKFYLNFQPWYGSQWFALTGDTIGFILQFVQVRKEYMRFMRFTEGSYEMFFQTILANSERKSNLCDHQRYLQWLGARKDGGIFIHKYSSLRYMDWPDREKAHPAILDGSYFNTLRDSGELFARKMDEKESAELLDRIDAKLLKN